MMLCNLSLKAMGCKEEHSFEVRICQSCFQEGKSLYKTANKCHVCSQQTAEALRPFGLGGEYQTLSCEKCRFSIAYKISFVKSFLKKK
jgi:hypothetical protein